MSDSTFRDLCAELLAHAQTAQAIPVAERLRLLQAGIRSGYMAGHDAAVEGRYGDPDEVAADLAPEVLQELDALPLPGPTCEQFPTPIAPIEALGPGHVLPLPAAPGEGA